MNKKKKIFLALLILLIATVVTTYCCDKLVVKAASGKLYADVNSIPFNRVGLLLGTSKFVASGRENPYYLYRIRAALQLLNAHKIKYLIISGDNGRKEYNEPESMRSDLINAGIDSTIIYLDYAGFRTFDSVKRLKEIFGQDTVTVISQQFHNERAIYIANRERIAAIGFNARDVFNSQGSRIQLREKLARVKVFVDYWFGTKPKYLGNKVVSPL
jgi:SanA protein